MASQLPSKGILIRRHYLRYKHWSYAASSRWVSLWIYSSSLIFCVYFYGGGWLPEHVFMKIVWAFQVFVEVSTTFCRLAHNEHSLKFKVSDMQ